MNYKKVMIALLSLIVITDLSYKVASYTSAQINIPAEVFITDDGNALTDLVNNDDKASYDGVVMIPSSASKGSTKAIKALEKNISYTAINNMSRGIDARINIDMGINKDAIELDYEKDSFYIRSGEKRAYDIHVKVLDTSVKSFDMNITLLTESDAGSSSVDKTIHFIITD